MTNIDTKAFAQIDFFLLAQHILNRILDIRTIHALSLTSQHFLLYTEINVHIERPPIQSSTRKDKTLLREPAIAEQFAIDVANRFMKLTTNTTAEEPSQYYNTLTKSMHDAADHILHAPTKTARKPWISGTTLQLIDERNKVRHEGNYIEEKVLTK